MKNEIAGGGPVGSEKTKEIW
jgi:uncharacterized protein YpuA (DUF1002 family)